MDFSERIEKNEINFWRNMDMLIKKGEAQSKSQQRFMGMVHAYKNGTLDTSNLPDELVLKIKKAAKSMTKEEVDDFASTDHKGLPEKKASMKSVKVIQPFSTILGAGAGSVGGAAIQDERYRRLAKEGLPVSAEKHVAEVMKGMLVGGMVGAGVGLGAGSKIRKARAKAIKGKPRADTARMLDGMRDKQKFLENELLVMSNKFKDFPELAKYRMPDYMKMNKTRTVDQFASKKGVSAQRMMDEFIKDVHRTTLKNVKKEGGVRRALEFEKAWRTRELGTGKGAPQYLRARATKNWGLKKVASLSEEDLIPIMKKVAAGRYEEQRYKSHVRDRSGKERLRSGIAGAGLPSAAITAGAGLFLGSKKPFRDAAMVGAVMTGFGTVLTPKQKRVFVPTND